MKLITIYTIALQLRQPSIHEELFFYADCSVRLLMQPTHQVNSLMNQLQILCNKNIDRIKFTIKPPINIMLVSFLKTMRIAD